MGRSPIGLALSPAEVGSLHPNELLSLEQTDDTR